MINKGFLIATVVLFLTCFVIHANVEAQGCSFAAGSCEYRTTSVKENVKYCPGYICGPNGRCTEESYLSKPVRDCRALVNSATNPDCYRGFVEARPGFCSCSCPSIVGKQVCATFKELMYLIPAKLAVNYKNMIYSEYSLYRRKYRKSIAGKYKNYPTGLIAVAEAYASKATIAEVYNGGNCKAINRKDDQACRGCNTCVNLLENAIRNANATMYTF